MHRTCWKTPGNGMRNKKNDIKVVAASVRGALHEHKDLPCQDCFKHVRGKNFVAVVSDGAGSAKYGKIGAKIACETLCDILKNGDFSQAKDLVCKAVKSAREKLMRHRFNRLKNEAGIADFAATIVGIVHHGKQGLFFHIGDGAAIAIRDGNYTDFVASRPENGSFACETFFYTQQAWQENLRFTPFECAQTIFLMSDGLTSFSFANDFREIEKGFIAPIDRFLSEEKTRAKAIRALANTLNTPKAQRINPDDKTLVWAKVN